MKKTVKINLLINDAYNGAFSEWLMPTKGTERSEGWDIYLPEDILISPTTRYNIAPVVVSTKIAFKMPRGIYAVLYPRSSTSVKHNVTVDIGIIDNDYNGPVHCVMRNFNEKSVTLKKGTRIAQLVFNKPVRLKQEKFDTGTRGGLGSTGI